MLDRESTNGKVRRRLSVCSGLFISDVRHTGSMRLPLTNFIRFRFPFEREVTSLGSQGFFEAYRSGKPGILQTPGSQITSVCPKVSLASLRAVPDFDQHSNVCQSSMQ